MTLPSSATPTPRGRPAPVLTHVLRAERLTPGLVRVVLGGPGLMPFVPDERADSYVKLMFLPAGPRPLSADGRVDIEAVKAALPDGVAPRLRAYTVRRFDRAALELTLDVVVHGTEGLAGPWAARVRGGEEALVVGPGGGWSPAPDVDHHLLVGDASALPAIAVALERLPADARGWALVEVQGPEHELPLTAPPGLEVRWVHASPAAPGRRLVAATLDLPWPAGRVGAFVHGEAGAVRDVRRYLRLERGLPRTDLSASGYWRVGVDDEGWRSTKREWTTAIEQQEQAAGLP
ncbi:siderophore-interacting protein [Cellulomonas persica]|uniref:Siderophore-interacting protein n=1 Tax=Cellulomonas persica TaxID=76861 RepID=A0A510UYB9_9CELL|nr:siderophore-interacting protein [Cellulomonas persica]GEK18070.1 siderophore-interacting protein [Cellulomonas persica]